MRIFHLKNHKNKLNISRHLVFLSAARYPEEDTHISHAVLILEKVNNSVFYTRFHFLSNSWRKFRRSSFSISRSLTLFSKSSGLFVGRLFSMGRFDVYLLLLLVCTKLVLCICSLHISCLVLVATHLANILLWWFLLFSAGNSFALFCFPYKKPPAVDISILLQEAFLFNVRFYGFSSEWYRFFSCLKKSVDVNPHILQGALKNINNPLFYFFVPFFIFNGGHACVGFKRVIKCR